MKCRLSLHLVLISFLSTVLCLSAGCTSLDHSTLVKLQGEAGGAKKAIEGTKKEKKTSPSKDDAKKPMKTPPGTNGSDKDGNDATDDSGGTDESSDKDPSDTAKFFSLHFGVGVGITSQLGSKKYVKSARVVNGRVRVEDESRERAVVVLEAHYLFDFSLAEFITGTTPPEKRNRRQWGWGPFVAVQADTGDDSVINGVGGGLMLALKYADENEDQDGDKTASFNLGVGVMVEPKAMVLGRGLREGQLSPMGEDNVRLRERSKVSGLIFLSFGF